MRVVEFFHIKKPKQLLASYKPVLCIAFKNSPNWFVIKFLSKTHTSKPHSSRGWNKKF